MSEHLTYNPGDAVVNTRTGQVLATFESLPPHPCAQAYPDSNDGTRLLACYLGYTGRDKQPYNLSPDDVCRPIMPAIYEQRGQVYSACLDGARVRGDEISASTDPEVHAFISGAGIGLLILGVLAASEVRDWFYKRATRRSQT